MIRWCSSCRWLRLHRTAKYTDGDGRITSTIKLRWCRKCCLITIFDEVQEGPA